MKITVKKIYTHFGYSLIVLSALILVIGTIMTAVIGIYNVDNIHRRTFETTNRFKTVDVAITSYLAKYGKLPCPAPLNCDINGCVNNTDKLGKEKRGNTTSSFMDSSNNIEANCVVDGKGIFETVNENKEKILYGNIPAASLGLANNYLVDAWGNKIVYMVPEELTQDEALKKIVYQKQVLKEKGAENVKTEKYLGDGEVFMLMSFNVNTPGSFSYDSKKSNYFNNNETKLENLPINNFKVNKNNQKYLYFHKKLEGLFENFNSETSPDMQTNIGEPDCEEVKYTYTFNIKNDYSSTSTQLSEVGQSKIFSYTGNVQEFVVPDDVKEIFIETWGARGGHSKTDNGGQGGYSYGYYDTTKVKKLYVYVGGKGGDKVESFQGGGWNGGGLADGGALGEVKDGAGGGGGASDVRTIGGNWDNMNSLKSRIIVAGGGGGASGHRHVCLDIVREIGGYGGGGNNRGGRGMSGHIPYNGVCAFYAWAAGGGIKQKGEDYNERGIFCKSDSFLGRSYYQGGGGYYGGGSNVCSPNTKENYLPPVSNPFSCKNRIENGDCGSGGGGSGYIDGVSDRTTMNSSIGPGNRGGQNGASCSHVVVYNDENGEVHEEKIDNLGCNNINYTKTFTVLGLSDIKIDDGEGKVRITYVNIDTPTESEDKTTSKTYTYTLTFPKTKYGEETTSKENCPKLVNISSKPLDFYLLSNNRDIRGNLINNKATNICERGGKWKYAQEDYRPEDPSTKTKKCIILPKCKNVSSLGKYNNVVWDLNSDNVNSGGYKIVNTGIVQGTIINKNNTREIIKLQCIVKLKNDVNCGNNMSCYADSVNNYIGEYYIK